MKVAAGIVGGLILGAALGWGIAYKQQKTVNTASTPIGECSAGATSENAENVFELDGKVYTKADLPAEIRSSVYEIEHQSYERLSSTLKQLALQLALAKDANKDVKLSELPSLESLLKLTAPTEAELKQIFEANKERLPPGMTFDTVKHEIQQFITNQKMAEALRVQTADLEAKKRIKILAKEPVAPTINLDLTGFPSKGSEKAAATLVEISDYLCPHCQQVQTDVDAIKTQHGEKIRFVQVNFALRPETLSGQLARGAFCAQQQSNDLFWRFHSEAFKVAKEKSLASNAPEDKQLVLDIAKTSGVDQEKLTACLDSEEARNAVKNTTTRMEAIGVTGTPTFFLNGQKVHMHGTSLKNEVESALKAAT